MAEKLKGLEIKELLSGVCIHAEQHSPNGKKSGPLCSSIHAVTISKTPEGIVAVCEGLCNTGFTRISQKKGRRIARGPVYCPIKPNRLFSP